ncbi:hypothetical protein [Bradyrhizobium sp. WD16]|nr:hypothetical protein [Bradyrhizobium sp. WD16]
MSGIALILVAAVAIVSTMLTVILIFVDHENRPAPQPRAFGSGPRRRTF